MYRSEKLMDLITELKEGFNVIRSCGSVYIFKDPFIISRITLISNNRIRISQVNPFGGINPYVIKGSYYVQYRSLENALLERLSVENLGSYKVVFD